MLKNISRNNPKRKNSSPGNFLWLPYPVSMQTSSRRKSYSMIILIALAFFAILSVIFTPLSGSRSPGSKADSFLRGSSKTIDDIISKIPQVLDLAVVADLDKKSRVKDLDSKKPKYYSLLKRGKLKVVPSQISNYVGGRFKIEWNSIDKFYTQTNEAGRGFELSELKWFRGNLYSFDDRTGIVYKLNHFQIGDTMPLVAYPQHIIMEGTGESSKGQKHEWATVKDGELYIGSIGKEYTNNEGKIVNENNFWVAIINAFGKIRHVDWKSHYTALRKAVGCEYPGYLIHEAIEWSSVHRNWFVLPRRVSNESYNDMRDEKMGSNILMIANEDFSSIEVKKIGKIVPERGFSSFKFLPNSQDRIIVAIKSMENEEEAKQNSYITVFDIDGHVLMDETLIEGGYKYEGISFLQDWTPRPAQGL